MNRTIDHIMWTIVASCGASCLYFLSLVLHLPFIWTIGFVLLWVAGCIYLFRSWVLPTDPGRPVRKTGIALAGICLYMMVNLATAKADKHGGWDAFAIWNFHARYLADPIHWQQLFLNTDSEHPDYPPGQPSLIALLFRLAGGRHFELLSYAVSLLVTLLTPVLILARLWDRNRLVALLLFYFLCTDASLVLFGVSQYADMMVGLLLLCVVVATQEICERPQWAAIATFLMGCLMWTKNEGVILAGMNFLFFAPLFLSRGRIWYSLAGGALPLLAWGVFKVYCPVHNDMTGALNHESWLKIQDLGRYKLIWTQLDQVTDRVFHKVTLLALVSFVFALVRKRMPGRAAWYLLSCLIVYLCIYVVTPHDLEWHLQTSLDRLLLQLMPSAVLLFAMPLAETPFSFTAMGRAGI
jgi:hypothetical protein